MRHWPAITNIVQIKWSPENITDVISMGKRGHETHGHKQGLQ